MSKILKRLLVILIALISVIIVLSKSEHAVSISDDTWIFRGK